VAREPGLRAGWLVQEGRVLASADVAATRAARRRGVIGRTDLDGALVLQPCRWVHSCGAPFTLDVAYLDADGTVIKVQRLARWRIAQPVPRARSVVEARAGSFERWGVALGGRLEVRTP
jgi:uncharacterized membrane protein (UPF0127 family)